jgi:photosystem II stability/assembly factor-like uncharacterized protein
MIKSSAMLFCFMTILVVGCKKDPEIIEEPESKVEIASWDVTKSLLDFSINGRDMFFVNPQTGFIVGSSGDIYKTSNAGNSWQKLNSGTTLNLFSVFFLDEKRGFVAGQALHGCLDPDCDKGAVLLKTTDGGISWSKTFYKDYVGLHSIKFFDDSNGLAIVNLSNQYPRMQNIAKTKDGGNSWELLNLPVRAAYDKFLYVDDVVFIGGEDQKIYKSRDRGLTWETLSTPIEVFNDVRNIYFYNENIGLLDGNGKIYRTTDGGQTWQLGNYPFSSFGLLHFYSETEGFNLMMVAEQQGAWALDIKGSEFYLTKNGGNDWERSELFKKFYIGFSHFPRKDLGYGVSHSGFYTFLKK